MMLLTLRNTITDEENVTTFVLGVTEYRRKTVETRGYLEGFVSAQSVRATRRSHPSVRF